MGPQQSPAGAAHPATGGPAGIGNTGAPSPAAAPEMGTAEGDGTLIGTAAAGGIVIGVVTVGRTDTLPTGAARDPTTVPPGRAVAMAGSSAGTGGIAGDWAMAVVPLTRAALESH